jgi:transcription antitermination factor NusB
MVSTFDPRHNARLLLLEQIFENEFTTLLFEKGENSSNNKIPLEIDALKELSGIKSYNITLHEKISECLRENTEAIDNLLRPFVTERPLEDISKVDLAILRISIAEVIFLRITPFTVSIDESIELAKEFGGIDDGRFVNGVLDRLFKKELII